MNAQKKLSLLTIMLLVSFFGFVGCGEFDDDPALDVDNSAQPEENSEEEEEDPDETDPSENNPQNNSDKNAEPGDDAEFDVDGQWTGPTGPAGGIYTRLWSGQGHYFSVQRDAEGQSHLWRSESGDEWTDVTLPDGAVAHEFREMVDYDGELFLSGTVLLHSDDEGQSWKPYEWDGIDPLHVAVARVFDGELYVVTEVPGSTANLYRITGDDVVLLDDELPSQPVDLVVDGETMLLSRGSYIGEILVKDGVDADWESVDAPEASTLEGIALHHHDGVFFATSGAGVWTSFDGQIFDELTPIAASEAVFVGDELYFGLLEPWNYLMSMDISDLSEAAATVEYLGGLDSAHEFLLATDGESLVGAMYYTGLLRMELGLEEWQQVTPSLRSVVSAVQAGGNEWVLTAEGRIFRSSGGGDWQRQPLGEHLAEKIIAGGNELYVVTKAGEFFTLWKNQDSWSLGEPVALSDGRVSELITYDDVLVVSFMPIVLSGRGGSTAIGGGLFLADNFAMHWTDWNKIDRGLPEQYDHRDTPPVYAMHADEDLMVVIGYDGIYRSVDHGESWNKATVEQGLPTANLNAGRKWIVKSDEALFAAVYTGVDTEIRRSEDDGQTWSVVNHSLPSSTVPMALHARGSSLLLGTRDGGVLFSTDDAESWSPIGQDYPGGAIRTIDTDASTLRVVTSRGLMELPL